MKTKISIVGFVAMCVLFGGVSYVSAEQESVPVVPSGTVSDTSGMTIAQLQELIAKLQAKLAAQNNSSAKKPKIIIDSKEKMGVPHVVAKRLEIRSELAKGGAGEEVKLLQRILASDASVYPEGLTTGFFGELTSKALTRLQTKFGLEVTGTMTTETRELINKILESEGVTDTVPQALFSKPGLRERVKMEWKFNNGRLERMIRIDSEHDAVDEEGLEIEIEKKSNAMKVKVEYNDKKTTYLFGTTNVDDVIKKLSIKLGLSEEVIRNAANVDSDDDSDDDSDEDDDN